MNGREVKREISIPQQMIWGLLLVVVVSVLGIGVWSLRRNLARQGTSDSTPLEGLKIFGSVPDFLLTERDGRQVTLPDLKGKVLVTNFIYTNCPDTCPIQSAQMRELQAEFIAEKDVRLVSITVDPERDTPKILSEYAHRFGADSNRWLFLTGEKRAIYRLAQEGFYLAAVEIPQEKRPSTGATHTHSPRFVLIDRVARIRGYYTATDAETMVRLRRDLKTLLRTGE